MTWRIAPRKMPSAVWPVHFDPEHLYFITFAAIRHAHIFRSDVIKRILVDVLNTGRILGHFELYGFVIMPNHVHFIIKCLDGHRPSDFVRDYKKTTASLILQ